MYAGKSTKLLEHLKHAPFGVLIKPMILTKQYATKDTITHDGKTWPVIYVRDITSNALDHIVHNYSLICIDEIQLYDRVDVQYIKRLKHHDGKILIIAGLNGTFIQRGFITMRDVMGDLIAISDDIVLLKAKCDICGNQAIYSMRRNNNTHEIDVNPDNYYPVCSSCYARLHMDD
jgi:thymidine kinase